MEKEKKIKEDEKVGSRAWPLKRRLQSPGERAWEQVFRPHEGGSRVAAQAVWGLTGHPLSHQ